MCPVQRFFINIEIVTMWTLGIMALLVLLSGKKQK